MCKKIINLLGILAIKIVGKTLRIKEYGKKDIDGIFIFWHSCFFPLIYANRFRNISVLISSHIDGMRLGNVIKHFGFIPVFNPKFNYKKIAIAPDGPKGPKNYLKPGAIKLAKKMNLPIFPVGVYISHKKIFGSWDRFNFPLPFSRCVIYYGEPIKIENDNEKTRIFVENELNRVNNLANQYAKSLC